LVWEENREEEQKEEGRKRGRTRTGCHRDEHISKCFARMRPPPTQAHPLAPALTLDSVLNIRRVLLALFIAAKETTQYPFSLLLRGRTRSMCARVDTREHTHPCSVTSCAHARVQMTHPARVPEATQDKIGTAAHTHGEHPAPARTKLRARACERAHGRARGKTCTSALKAAVAGCMAEVARAATQLAGVMQGATKALLES